MLGFSSSKLDCGFYIACIVKSTSRKIGTFMYFRRFFLLRLCIFIVNPSFSLAWNIVVMIGLVFPTATWICYMINYKDSCVRLLVLICCFSWTLEYHQNVASTNLFCSYYFGRCLSELTELVPLNSHWRFSCYCNKFFDFPVTICLCYENVCVTSFFLHTAKPWNS